MTTVKKYKGHDVPDGATHYSLLSNEFLKWTGSSNNLHHNINGRWIAIPFRHTLNSTDIELPQEPEQWMPEVGAWCEVESDTHGEHKKAFYVGLSADGSHIFDVEQKWLWRLDTSMHVRPIKTERERFIEQATKLDAAHVWTSAEFAGDMFDNGARFSGGEV